MSRWIELFEDSKSRMSSTSTGFLSTVAVLSFAVIFMTVCRAYMEAVSMAGILAGMTGLTKATGKWNESSVEKAAYNPAPTVAQPAPSLGPTTIINTGDKNGKNSRSDPE